MASMGKKLRAGEPAVQEQELRRRGWPIAGSIHPPGQIEGGDVVWLDLDDARGRPGRAHEPESGFVN